MKNLTPELIAKAKAAKSREELLALAKENGIELTEEEAKKYFEQLNTNGAVSDDELEAVSGGGFICDLLGIRFSSDEDKDASELKATYEPTAPTSNITRCPYYTSPSMPGKKKNNSIKL